MGLFIVGRLCNTEVRATKHEPTTLQVVTESHAAPESADTRVLSPKRTVMDKTGVYSWVQYHAGFSPRFVGSVVSYLGLDSESEILDPFLGTGATCLEARRRGVPSTGIELNGFAYYVARARVAWSFTASELESELQDLSALDGNHSRSAVVRPQFKRWFGVMDETPQELTELGLRVKEIQNKDLRDFLIAALALTIRHRARFSVGTNPAWVRLGKGRPGPKGDLLHKLRAKAMQMFDDQFRIRGDISTPVELKRMDMRHFQP